MSAADAHATLQSIGASRGTGRLRDCLRLAACASLNTASAPVSWSVCSVIDSRRGRRFLDQRRVLLRHLVHLRDRAVDLLDAGALLLAGGG